MSDYFDRRPLHLPAAERAGRAGTLGWDRLNALLAIRPHWTEANIKLIMNSRPVYPQHYIDEVRTLGGRARWADPAKVDLFLAMGASMVGNAVEEVAPEVREVTAALGRQFGGAAGANAYCSFREVQAFDSHCDLHEVFAVHCEGEKVWNVYENRAEAPVRSLDFEGAQQVIDRAKGGVAMRVTMRPGDLLYIPRGFYHDATASSEASLHLTFSVAPLFGTAIFGLLQSVAEEQAEFRHYLPDSRHEGGEPLRRRLEALGEGIAEILRSPALLAELGARQRTLAGSAHRFDLPRRRELRFYARSDQPAEVRSSLEGARLATRSEETAIGGLGAAAEWLLGRPAFSAEELIARSPGEEEDALRSLVGQCERLGLIYRYQPQI
jgi:hypothetical protein